MDEDTGCSDLAMDPNNPRILFSGMWPMLIKRFNPIGGDHHDMWIDPMLPDWMMVGNDGGVSISMNGGQSWIGGKLPIAQMYHVAVDNQIPYYVYGNMQDGPSHRGPSNSRTRGGISSGMWHSVGGCESGHAIPDPVENNIVWQSIAFNGPSPLRYHLITTRKSMSAASMFTKRPMEDTAGPS